MYLHAKPLDICAVVYVDDPKQGNGDPLCSAHMPLDIVQREFLRCSKVGSDRGGSPLHSIPILLHICGEIGVTQT